FVGPSRDGHRPLTAAHGLDSLGRHGLAVDEEAAVTVDVDLSRATSDAHFVSHRSASSRAVTVHGVPFAVAVWRTVRARDASTATSAPASASPSSSSGPSRGG